MRTKKIAVTCLLLSLLFSTSANAANTSTNIGGGKGIGYLTSQSSGAQVSTVNYTGSNYTYAKATIDYSDGDWDIQWGDGLGSASASVSAKAGATITYWSGTHVVRTKQSANAGVSYTGSTSLSRY